MSERIKVASFVFKRYQAPLVLLSVTKVSRARDCVISLQRRPGWIGQGYGLSNSSPEFHIFFVMHILPRLKISFFDWYNLDPVASALRSRATTTSDTTPQQLFPRLLEPDHGLHAYALNHPPQIY